MILGIAENWKSYRRVKVFSSAGLRLGLVRSRQRLSRSQPGSRQTSTTGYILASAGALITTDGFAFYTKVIRRVFGPACLYGQAIKTRRSDRIVKIERRAVIGADWRLKKILADSEDTSKLNTSFIERLNLTIRQGSAYLMRRTICHARWKAYLEDPLELLRCYYNFVRRHVALKFGPQVRTPAMQAGLATRRLTFSGSSPRRCFS